MLTLTGSGAFALYAASLVLYVWHLYGDHATLRRELINHKLLTRKSDCSEYRKLQLEPDDEARALLQALRSPARKAAAKRSNRPPRVLPKAAAATPTGSAR